MLPIDPNDELFQAFAIYNLPYWALQDLWTLYLAQAPRKIPRKIPKRESRALFKRLEDEN